MTRCRSLLAGAAAALTVAGACRAADLVTVVQKNLAFSVASLTLAKGAVVRFVNSDATPHNVLITGAGSTINGGLQQPGDDFKAPFFKPGVYQVTCGIHPKMKMSIVVQ